MNLPVEIFSNLHERHKLECMLVFRKWKQVMEQGVPYDTVCIYTRDGLDKVTSKLSINRAVAIKVNAARNIRYVFEYEVILGERPEEFQGENDDDPAGSNNEFDNPPYSS